MEPAPNQETAEAVLTRKCKNLLAIAQKAKIARDEALEERVKLLNEIEAAKTEIKTKDRQFKTCEEMLAALTEQKLKLSMDMDSLKKEKSALVNQMSDLIREKEMNEIESENLKQQNTSLIRKSEGLSNELQIKGKSESQLLNDIKKLHENNESVKLLCSGLSDEKVALEKEIETVRLQLKKLSDERNVLNKALSSKLGSDQVDLNSFVEFIANSSSTVNDSEWTSELKKDNESLQTEVDSLKEKIQRLMSDLETANVDRDQMMNNLEDVRVETKTLIENVEKLNEEVESVKLEKDKSEDALNKIIESKSVEIERLLNEISNGKAYIDELLVSVQEQNDTSSQQLELNRELVQCKNDNENMIKQLAELNDRKEHENGITKSFLTKIKDTVVSAGDLNVLKSNNFNSLVDNLTKILNEQADDNLEARTDNVVNCLSECLACLFESQSEIDRLNASIEKLENSVESCNKNCEQMKYDLEELSSDNKTLLLDLMAMRQENALRVSELDEFMNRLKQRDKTIDDLKEINNCLEAKNEETVAEFTSKLSESNNNFVEEQNKNLKLQSELEIVKEELKSGESELKTLRDELVRINSEYDLLKEDFNKSQLEGSMMNQDALKLLTEENEGLKRDIMVIEGTCESYSLENKSMAEKLEELNQSLTSTSEELAQAKVSLLELESLKNQLEESNKKLVNNESLLKTTQELTKEGENYKITLEQMKENFEAKCLELENINKELSRLSDANNKLEQAKSTMESRNNELEVKFKSELSEMSTNLKTTEEDRLKLQESEAKLTESVERLECENEHLRGQLAQQKQDLSDQLEEKMEEIRQFEKELEEAKEMANFKNLELEEINRVWAGRFNTLKVNLVSLRRSLADLGRQVRELRSLFFDTIHSLNDVVTLKAEDVMDRSVTEAKTELFDEMRRMNEVLKERGESISKLQGLLTETESKFEAVIIQNRDVIEEQTKLKAQLKAKDEQLLTNENLIKELECEVAKLRELKDSAPESDALSTSTISRAEDSMRLRDVDDSIEEKYNKLKLIAVKLKKKSAELTQSLEQERSKFAVEKTELADKIQHLSSAAKNAHALQDSYDKMLDELEETKKQNRINSAAMKELKENEEAMKKRIVSLESCNANIPLMHKQSESLHGTVKELKSELNKLEMEKKVEVMKYEETKKQCVSLEAKIEQLTQSLDQAIQQSRTNNVLELEMDNYKKIVSDITGQLNAEKQKLAASEKECVSIKTVKNGLEEQISLFEKQVKAEESRNANLQEQVAAMREKSNATQKQVDELNSQLGDLKRELQTGKSQNEQQSLEMSALTSEFSRKEIELHDKVECFSSHIQSLETSLASMRQELSTSNSEKEHLREEFESYKLRAQSTLAKQKSDSVSQGEKEAREQLEKLKKELDGARQKMENNQTEIETLNSKLSSLQLEKARSDKRHEDMTKVLQQKITDFDTLNTEHRAFKISSENLLQNSKMNFEERETRLKEEIKTLKDLVGALNEKIELEAQEREQELVGITMGSGSNGNNATLFDSHHPIDNLSSLQEREDGEGSESVPPLNNYRRLSNLVPLDILLNNPIDDENRIPVLQSQIEKLHSELNSYEVRVKHIASLLSEAEKDAARSSQQNTVLKEELRRLERSLQREPHIANSEYLKNVIFKFLILQSGDERTRLVPVLDTILKLSKDEAGRLMAIAKGESTSTWGSYLHSWTGL